jgi:hypothetical protein
VHAGARPAKRENRAWRGLSKLSSAAEVDVVLGELETGRNEFHRRASSPRSKALRIP